MKRQLYEYVFITLLCLAVAMSASYNFRLLDTIDKLEQEAIKKDERVANLDLQTKIDETQMENLKNKYLELDDKYDELLAKAVALEEKYQALVAGR